MSEVPDSTKGCFICEDKVTVSTVTGMCEHCTFVESTADSEYEEDDEVKRMTPAERKHRLDILFTKPGELKIV